MSRDKQENFSIKVNQYIYEEYDRFMPYFELKIATINEDCIDTVNINWDYRYDLDNVEQLIQDLENFENCFDDIDIDKLVYVETYYCIPEESNTFVERIYQSPKYTEEQINEFEENF